MVHRLDFRSLTALALMLFSSSGFASSEKTQLKVTLFGQPCLMIAPSALEADLRVIHSMSPEQIPPAHTLANTRLALNKLSEFKLIPAALKEYVERFTKNLRGMEAYFLGLDSYKKSGDASPLIESIKPFLSVRDLGRLTTLAKSIAHDESQKKKTQPKGSPAPTEFDDDPWDNFQDRYQIALGPDPEAEFHRAIKKLGITYNCAFEEGVE